jgi:hypothetical protein
MSVVDKQRPAAKRRAPHPGRAARFEQRALSADERARREAGSARTKLRRLMPFDEWCEALDPTPAARELYRFVERSLRREIGQAYARSARRATKRPQRAAGAHAEGASKTRREPGRRQPAH